MQFFHLIQFVFIFLKNFNILPVVALTTSTIVIATIIAPISNEFYASFPLKLYANSYFSFLNDLRYWTLELLKLFIQLVNEDVILYEDCAKALDIVYLLKA